MEPYPQKPNVTRTSKHEGSYSFEGMKRKYKTDQERRKELEAKQQAGKLDKSMEPYLAWLQGERDGQKQNTEFHEKAQVVICKLNRDDKELAEAVGNEVSEYAIKRIRLGDFTEISTSYAKNIYYKMKSLL